MHKRLHQGFTIIETVTVIFIIAVLAAITVVAYNTVQAQARDSKRQSDVTLMTNALEKYYDEHGEYPTGCSEGNASYGALCGGGPFAVTSNTDVLAMNTSVATLRTILPAITTDFGDPKQVTGQAFGNGKFQSPVHYMYSGELVSSSTGLFSPFTSNFYDEINCNSGSSITFTTNTAGTRTTYILAYYSEVDDKWYIYQGKRGKALTVGSTDVRGTTYGKCVFVR